MEALTQRLERGLIISCHADEHESIDPVDLLQMYVAAAEKGGAAGLRVESAKAITAIRKRTALPIIGFARGEFPDGSDLITPAVRDIEALFAAGADAVAIDCTKRRRPDGSDGFVFFEEARRQFSQPLWADCSVFREAVHAAEIGADFVATTLSGYTPATSAMNHGDPDYDMIRELSLSLTIPVIAEGRVWTPEAAVRALEAGAHAVVVGSAITRPSVITRMFSDALASTAPRT